MALNIDGYGVVQIKIDTSYHSIVREIVLTEYDLVGFYYKAFERKKSNNPHEKINLKEIKEEYMVILYDVVTGIVTSRERIKWETIYKDPSVRQIYISQMIPSEENSKIKTKGKIFNNCLLHLISERTNKKDCYKNREKTRQSMREYFQYILGDKIIPNTGYTVVNKVIKSIEGKNTSNLEWKCICENSILRSPVLISPPNFRNISKDNFRNELIIMFDVIRDMSCSRPDVSDIIINGIRSSKVNNPEIKEKTPNDSEEDTEFVVTFPDNDESNYPEDKITLVVPEDKMKHVGEKIEFQSENETFVYKTALDNLLLLESQLIENINSHEYGNSNNIIIKMNKIRNEISDERSIPHLDITNRMMFIHKEISEMRKLMGEINYNLINEDIPIIRLNEIIKTVNNLCSYIGIDNVDYLDQIGTGSYKSLIVSDNSEIYDKEVNLNLKSGETIIIPSMNSNLKNISSDTLKEILYQLNAQEFNEKNYNILKFNITKEIAIRRINKNVV